MRTTIDTTTEIPTALLPRAVPAALEPTALLPVSRTGRALGRSQSRAASFGSRPDQQQPDVVLPLLADEHLHLDPRGPPLRAGRRFHPVHADLDENANRAR